MPTIRNFALHPFDFPRAKGDKLSFPAGVNAGNDKVKPSYTEIDDEALEELKAHAIGSAWFGPDALVVEGTGRYEAPALAPAEGEKSEQAPALAPEPTPGVEGEAK